MTELDRDGDVRGQRIVAPSMVVWHLVVPALGFALILGASLLPAIAIAGAAAVAINVALASVSPRGQSRPWRPGKPARQGALRGS